MTIQDIEKKIVHNTLKYLGFLLFSLGLFGLGAFFIEKAWIPLSILTMGLALFAFIYPIIWLFKNNRLLFQMLVDKQKEVYIYTFNDENIDMQFQSMNQQRVTFDDYTFQVGDLHLRYEDCVFAFFVFYRVGFKTSATIPCLMVHDEKGLYEHIPLDANLIEVIKKYEIPLENDADFSYLLNHPDDAFHQIRKRKPDPNQVQSFYTFIKNEEDKKVFKKMSQKSIIISIVVLLVAIGVNVFFAWLENSPQGITISDSFTFNLGFKLFYTGILSSLIFVKSKKLHIYCKILIAFYMVVYWIEILFLSPKASYIIDFIFLVLLVIFSFVFNEKQTDKPKHLKKPFNRCFGLAMFLMVINVSILSVVELESDRIWLLTSLYITIGFAGVFITGLLMYYKKQKTILSGHALKVQRNSVIALAVSLPILIFFFVMIYLHGFNFALDQSEPSLHQVEIIELYKDSDNNRMVTVDINGFGKSFEISSAEYESLSIGEIVAVARFQGAFNWPYYFFVGNID